MASLYEKMCIDNFKIVSAFERCCSPKQQHLSRNVNSLSSYKCGDPLQLEKTPIGSIIFIFCPFQMAAVPQLVDGGDRLK